MNQMVMCNLSSISFSAQQIQSFILVFSSATVPVPPAEQSLM